jgi:T4 RnlA family RNA ligase
MQKFPRIELISDIQPMVADKKEIKFSRQPNGVTVGCYVFCDSHTFDAEGSTECRGIAFDSSGKICSRPLHKFFNVGEKSWLMPELILERSDLATIQEKLDGSMISTAWVDGQLLWRSKKSFESDVVKLAEAYLTDNPRLLEFSRLVASSGYTASFELTHPEARIVVAAPEAALRLLHVRNNVTGDYVLLYGHEIWDWISEYKVPLVHNYGELSLVGAFDRLEQLENQEGYVLQFHNGDMVKAKTAWYRRLHRSVTFLRERSIAELALNEELDDVKSMFREIGIDLAAVEEVESRVKAIMVSLTDQVEAVYQDGAALDRKSFAIRNKEHPLFSLIMNRYIGRDVGLKDWYIKRRLSEDFSLRVLADAAKAEAIEG